MGISYFDSHAHLDDAKFEDFEGGRDGAISKSIESGVSGFVNIGTNPETSRNSISLAEKYPFVYASVAVYPTDAQYLGDRLDAALIQIEQMLSHPKVVALGEIGLDYHYDDTDKDVQKYAFERQMQIAEKHNVPVVIHDRDAHGDTMEVIKKYPKVRGVMHSFSGSAEMARQLTDLGWYISFSGPVTYKNASKVKEAAQVVPDEYLLVETDSPYLPPVPHRGETNYPGLICHTVREVAALRGITEEEAAELTLANARRFFNI